ncbi:MAG: thioredoxin family protein [Thermoanaerobaculia bacterium]
MTFDGYEDGTMMEQNWKIKFENGRWLPAISLVLVALLVAPAWSQTAPGGTLTDFQPVTYRFEVAGRPLADAEVYQSRSTGSMLILATELEAPVLIRLREGRVETVNMMKVDKKPDGSVTLLQNPTLAPLGSYRLTSDRAGVGFDLNGQEAVLREKPHLLGNQKLESMQAYSLEYVRGAAAYTPSNPVVAKLREQPEDVKVLVFFGSWCSACKQMVPRIMKVDEQLDGSKIQIDYYGLPQGSGFSADTKASALGISSVPTGVVFLGGKEIGRISGNGWKIPELAINNVLVKAQS